MKKDTKIAVALIILAVLIVVIPPFVLKGAEFGGSDDAGSQKIEEIAGDYEPWFTPLWTERFRGKSKAFCSVSRPLSVWESSLS